MTGRANTNPPAGTPGMGVMDAKGYYNQHSQTQASAGAYGFPLLERAVREMPLPPRGVPFTIADYGCAGGRNSLAPVRTAIAALRRRSRAARPVSVTHTDQPENDFNSLFRSLAESPESYLRADDNVFAFAAGRGFYERIFPSASISLGWQSIAAHWLSRIPCPATDQIWTNSWLEPTPAQRAEQEAWARQAKADWHLFLEQRAWELQPGGRLVIVAGGCDEDGRSGAEGILAVANEALQQLVAAGELRPGEYARMGLPIYNRTLAEFWEPFAAGRAKLPGGTLQMEVAERVLMPDGYLEQYCRDGNARAFAAGLTGFLRAFSESSLFSNLDPDRTPADRERLANAAFARFQQLAAADPPRAAGTWQLILMLIAREIDPR